jgi:hypothetical protein
MPSQQVLSDFARTCPCDVITCLSLPAWHHYSSSPSPHPHLLLLTPPHSTTLRLTPPHSTTKIRPERYLYYYSYHRNLTSYCSLQSNSGVNTLTSNSCTVRESPRNIPENISIGKHWVLCDWTRATYCFLYCSMVGSLDYRNKASGQRFETAI